MQNSDNKLKLDQLIADYLCGACDESQQQHLLDLIEQDPRVATYVARHVAINRVLKVMQTTTSTADRVMAAISDQQAHSPTDVERLIADYVADCLNAEEKIRLLRLCENDRGVAELLNRHLQLHRVLQEANQKAINANVVMCALPQKRDSSLKTRVLQTIESREQKQRWRSLLPLATSAVMLLVVWVSYYLISQPIQPNNSAVTTVAVKIKRQDVPVMRAASSAEWPNNKAPFDELGQLTTNHVDLSAGIAEIEMPSGAVMVIQGPTLLEITGHNSARLMLGRITTYVPPRAVGFSLLAEGLEVIDLGTSFGISQGLDGVADVHVFSGAVDAIAAMEGKNERLHLKANDAVRISPRGGKWERVPCDPDRFVFSLHPQNLALDLADIIAGGDGFGSGVADGLDPTTGRLVSAPAYGYGVGDGTYHPVESLMAIDGVFIPDGTSGDNQITSLGDRFQFPKTKGQSYDLIRRGGTYDISRFGGRPEQPGVPPILNGTDYRTPGHSVIGMHANAGFTIDLQAVAYRHPEMYVNEFRAVVGNVGKKGASGKTDFWLFVDGQLVHHEKGMDAKKPAKKLSIKLDKTNRYLTLVSTDYNQDMAVDWLTLADPRLYLGALH